MNRSGSIARLVNHAASEAVLRDALDALAQRDLDVMPLKGVLLRRVAYDDPSERAVGDVDLLVRGRDFAAAHEALCANGFDPLFLEAGERERCFRHRRTRLLVDLHWQLFHADYFLFDTDGLFARARRDDALFPAPAWRMADLDLYAHVLVHAGFSAWVVREPRLYDLPRLVSALAIPPEAAAEHLRAHEMDPFARYALRLVIARLGDAHAAAVLRALGADPLRDAMAVAVLHTMPRIRAHHYLAYLPRRTLYRSPEEAAASAAVLARRAVAKLLRVATE